MTTKRMQTADIAVVMPVYNRCELVKRTLRSIAEQELPPRQVILVDNASTDGTLATLRQWAAEHHGERGMEVTVLSECRPGAAAARNAGLLHVKAEWVMHFDSDDVMLPSHVKRAAEAAAATEADIIGWDVTLHTLGGKARTLDFATTNCLFHCVMHGMMASQRYMARTALVRRAGGWDPEVRIWNDVELGVRILALGPKVAKAAGPCTVDIYAQAESITGTGFSSRVARIELALAKMGASLPAELRYLPRLRAAIIAGCCRAEGNKSAARRLLTAALSGEPSRYRRLLLRLAAAYTAAGGRGAARLLHPIF